MTTQVACPACGTPMREIVWGYGTIADVADAGDVVIGGCVIDVDTVGRVAALQCPVCGTRADEHGVALERPQPPDTTEHPFAVAFSSSPPGPNEEVTMQQDQQPQGERTDGADASPYVDEDFGGIASGGDWRDHVEPYASREDRLPQPSAPSPERVEPYASREDALPERSAPAPDHVDPYASREDELPPVARSAPDRVDPYASREDRLPEAGGRGWRDRVEPFAPGAEPAAATGDAQDDARSVGDPGEAVPGEGAGAGEGVPGEFPGDAVPGEQIGGRSLDTSDFTDAEEEGWPPRDDD